MHIKSVLFSHSRGVGVHRPSENMPGHDQCLSKESERARHILIWFSCFSIFTFRIQIQGLQVAKRVKCPVSAAQRGNAAAYINQGRRDWQNNRNSRFTYLLFVFVVWTKWATLPSLEVSATLTGLKMLKIVKNLRIKTVKVCLYVKQGKRKHFHFCIFVVYVF